MVDTSETRLYATPDEISDNTLYTVDAESTHKINSYTDAKTKETRKRIVIAVLGLKRPILLNNTSRKNIEKWWGTDTAKWVGQKLRAKHVTYLIQGSEMQGILWEPAEGSEKQSGKKR